MFSLFVGVITVTLLLPKGYSEDLLCSELWNSTSTSDCDVDSSFINDNDCDCDDCSDEKYWNCNTCREGCDSFCGVETCDGGDFTTNLELDCNFYLLDELPIVEGECYSLEIDFSIFSGKQSAMMKCNNNNEAIVTYYNDSKSCKNTNGMYTQKASVYSCGGSANKCDKKTFKNQGYFGNDTNACSDKSLLYATISAVVANLGCVDDVNYEFSSSKGVLIEYYFQSDGTCSGDPYVAISLEPGCDRGNGFSQSVSISSANSLKINNNKLIFASILLSMIVAIKL